METSQLLLYIRTPHPTKWCADMHIISGFFTAPTIIVYSGKI
jgi:hypothetical protein